MTRGNFPDPPFSHLVFEVHEVFKGEARTPLRVRFTGFWTSVSRYRHGAEFVVAVRHRPASAWRQDIPGWFGDGDRGDLPPAPARHTGSPCNMIEAGHAQRLIADLRALSAAQQP